MGFRSIHELYKWSSCGVVMHKVCLSVCLFVYILCVCTRLCAYII